METYTNNRQVIVEGPPCVLCGWETRRRGFTLPTKGVGPRPRWRCTRCGTTRVHPSDRLRREPEEMPLCPCCGRGRMARVGKYFNGSVRLRCNRCGEESQESVGGKEAGGDGVLPEKLDGCPDVDGE